MPPYTLSRSRRPSRSTLKHEGVAMRTLITCGIIVGFLSPHVIKRRTRVLEDVELVEDDLRVRQHRTHRVEIRPMHVGAGGGDRRPLSPGQVLRQQRGGGSLRTVLSQPHHLAMHHVRQHGPKALALAAVNLIEADMPRLSLRARAIPLGQTGLLRAPGLASAHTMAHGGMTGRHRLTVHPNLLPQPTGDARLGVRELDPLGPNPAAATADTALLIDQRYGVCRPGQIIPGPLLRRPHTGSPSTTPTARISSTASLHVDPQSTLRLTVLTFDRRHSETGQAQNPRTIALRSHASSLVGSTSRENATGCSGAKWDRFPTSRPPSRPPTPSAVRAGGRVLPHIAVLKSVKSPKIWRLPRLSIAGT